MLRLGILVSGGGTNLQAIIDRVEDGYLSGCKVVTVVSSRPNVFALKRAETHDIPSIVIARNSYATFDSYTGAMLRHMEEYKVDLIVLAGFLSMLGEELAEKYKYRIINVHPSLIPAFCGKGFYGLIPHTKAIEHGVKVTGATVHFVDAEYDTGPIILQKAVEIKQDDTPETLQLRVMQEAEWKLLPQAIRLYADNRLKIEGRKVVIFENARIHGDGSTV